MFIFRSRDRALGTLLAADRLKTRNASQERSLFLKNLLLSKKDKSSDSCNSSLVLLIILISLWISGCNENRYNQCQQIFQIAHSVTNNTQKINSTASQKPQETKIWLQAAALMRRAAEQMRALPINDTDLIKYQVDLADIYQIYSQATFDAVKARESQNLEALLVARSHVATASQRQQVLVDQINTYCLNKNN